MVHLKLIRGFLNGGDIGEARGATPPLLTGLNHSYWYIKASVSGLPLLVLPTLLHYISEEKEKKAWWHRQIKVSPPPPPFKLMIFISIKMNFEKNDLYAKCIQL